MKKNNEVNNILSIDEVKQHKDFYKLYKFLFDKSYMDVSNDSKLLYSVVSNAQYRISKSKYREKYKDEQGKFFVEYTRKELAKILSCSVRKVSQLKKELEKIGLIEIGKRSRIYIKIPKVADKYQYIDKVTGNKKLSFYQIPKVFFNEKKYRNMSNVSKIVYSLLKARYELSMRNVKERNATEYIDEKGQVFCIYTNANLMSDLNVSEATIIDAKKELIVLSLMFDRKIQDKNNKRIYVNTPSTIEKNEKYPEDVSVNHAINEDKESEQEAVKEDVSNIDVQNKKVESAKIKVGQVQNMKPRYTDLRDTDINTNINDMYVMYKEYRESGKEKHTYQSEHANNILNFEEERKEIMLNKFPKLISMALKPMKFDEIKTILGIICNTKNMFNKDNYTFYDLEDVEFEMSQMIKRVTNKLKMQNESIKDGLGLYKTSTVNVYKDYDAIVRDENDLHVEADELDKWLGYFKNTTVNNVNKQNSKKDYIDLDEYINDHKEEIAELDAYGVY